MSSRATQKQQSRERILEAAGRHLRTGGIDGAGIAAVMSEAGLTHGAFYAHFSNKDELTRNALVHALEQNRARWLGKPQRESWTQRLGRLARRYLTGAHRQSRADSCALAALCSEAARGDSAFRRTYEEELLKSLSGLCEGPFETQPPQRGDDALAYMALLVGTLALSRAVASPALAERLLKAGADAAARIGHADPEQRANR
ncbi:TetR/AcrR family transcriptional regulator [Motiliproteus sp. SC1-56]|uniref:TetR/AcrR family transcriptional regulator n=1 Tax=Motiliproteus sp. SC1-56 TaxID=2799565 RepID=UPI001A90A6DF|nr:TetR/AcrR family transcriptional regulator [Motiliproteus sp. SC1-56]